MENEAEKNMETELRFGSVQRLIGSYRVVTGSTTRRIMAYGFEVLIRSCHTFAAICATIAMVYVSLVGAD